MNTQASKEPLMSTPVVITDVRKGTMWIRLNRPDAMNSLTPAVLRGIDHALNEAQSRGDVISVVLTGTGRAFCAGADLKYVKTQAGESGTSGFLDSVLSTMNRIDRFPKPVIAALNGITLAGGLELMIACDLVVANAGAKFGIPEVKRGLVAAAGGVMMLPDQIPERIAMELALTGDFIGAERAYQLGLINEVTEGSALDGAKALVMKDPRVASRAKTMDGFDSNIGKYTSLAYLEAEKEAF